MRALLTVLVLLAGLKVWTQDQMFRSATTNALIEAYRARAVDACRRGQQDGNRTWTDAASVKLVIGRSDVDVHLWDVDNPLWDTRFKHPHLVLSTGGGAEQLVCSYDVVAGMALVSRL